MNHRLQHKIYAGKTFLNSYPSVVAAIALILGIDRFMSEARAITNLIGNATATLVVAKWENEINLKTAYKVL